MKVNASQTQLKLEVESIKQLVNVVVHLKSEFECTGGSVYIQVTPHWTTGRLYWDFYFSKHDGLIRISIHLLSFKKHQARHQFKTEQKASVYYLLYLKCIKCKGGCNRKFMAKLNLLLRNIKHHKIESLMYSMRTIRIHQNHSIGQYTYRHTSIPGRWLRASNLVCATLSGLALSLIALRSRSMCFSTSKISCCV